MLSKHVRPENIIDENSENIVIEKTASQLNLYIFTLKDYTNKDLNLKKYKLAELKAIAKQNKLFVTGTKPVLIERINVHFTKSLTLIKIQKIMRGYLVRLTIKMQGPALRNRSICVNDTDFYTMEPLCEIPNNTFYSYTDHNNFTYGFDLNSLITLNKKSCKMLNPYNREKLYARNVNNIKKLERIIKFTYKTDHLPEDKLATTLVEPTPIVVPPHIVRPPIQLNTYSNTNNLFNLLGEDMPSSIQIDNLNRLNEIRLQPINTRIQGIFMEIDQLGHYTNSEWFLSLDRRKYYNFYRELYEIWRYRSQMTFITKRNICPYDPFNGIFTNNNYLELSIEQLREGTLKMMESIIYMGIDIDHRNLGAFHLLSALTVVSIPARTAMHWLYESLY